VRVEPQEGEDRRCDLSGLDGGGLDPNRYARATDNHQDVSVAGVHTTVLGELGRLRVDDAHLDLAEDVRVVTVVDRDAEEVGGGSAGPDLGEARVLDGDGVLVLSVDRKSGFLGNFASGVLVRVPWMTDRR
jgi:hypothetical protein